MKNAKGKLSFKEKKIKDKRTCASRKVPKYISCLVNITYAEVFTGFPNDIKVLPPISSIKVNIDYQNHA